MKKIEIPKNDRLIAYFSMEVGLANSVPTYSGGLGIMAGDTLKSFADLSVPAIGVTLLSKKGYFYQKLGADGMQSEQPAHWSVDDHMSLLPEKITIEIEGKQVEVQVWEYHLVGNLGFVVPIYFLDTDIESNLPEYREITSYLYGGDLKYRIMQEIVLGIGGTRMLKTLGYSAIKRYHMNEGHSAFLIYELHSEFSAAKVPDVMGSIHKSCVFTTHTPIAAGHDKFPIEMVNSVLGSNRTPEITKKGLADGKLNMTLLALNSSHYVNGVAKKHGEVTQEMFPGYSINSITNGVNSSVWVSESFRTVFNRHIPGWENDPFALRYAISIPKEEISEAHASNKKALMELVNSRANAGMDKDIFTIGFARRMTAYKRPDLLFSDLKKLVRISETAGKIQIVMAGKAHPHDLEGKSLIKKIFSIIGQLKGKINIAFLENYDIDTAKLIISGVDIWLNTPLRPLEASGTSGMKACHNGVPNFSVCDGWWLEGHIEGVTGWSIGPIDAVESSSEDVNDLYTKLEHIILPMFYKNYDDYLDVMRKSIAINASFFNTHRMVQQYVLNAYFR